VLPPDINGSQAYFTVCGDHIRFGFLAIKNVGASVIGELVAQREKNGNFKSFEDFLLRMPTINKRMLESLIKCGVFDSFGIYRSRLLTVFESALDTVARRNRSQITGQMDLFSSDDGEGEGELALSVDYPDIPEMTRKELLLMEKETAGIYLSGHPILDYTQAKESLHAVDISEIVASFGDEGTGVFREKDRVNLIGIIASKKIKITKNETKMAFLEFEDMTGIMEVIVFPNVFEQFSSRLEDDAVIALSGEISVKESIGDEAREEAKLILRSVLPIAENGNEQPKVKVYQPEKSPQTAPSPTPTAKPQAKDQGADSVDCLYLKLSSQDTGDFERVCDLLDIFSAQGQKTPVFLYFDDTKKLVRRGENIELSETLYKLLCDILGKENVAVKSKKLDK